jgi:pyruvate dehydrogenase E2 component (dihydrolipoamide acetyltransferase)
MATAVEMPKLGNTVEECLVSRWLKRKGDAVKEGEIVAEIETDKTNFEIAAPIGGVVLETFFPEGAVVPVFTNLFVIGTPDEIVEQFRPGSSPVPPITSAVSAAIGQTHSAKSESDNRQTHPPSAAWSPRARRFADAHDFHPAAIAGSGPRGRILEEDVRRAYEQAAGGTLSARAPAAPPPGGIRETIARRMRESLASTAQYTLNASADAGALLAARRRFKGSREMSEITINDLACFCTIQALREMPALNAEYVNGVMRVHDSVNLGFAVDTPRGLMVPVVRDAARLSLRALSVSMKTLSAQAVAGKIDPDALSGATFTVSNLGGLGIESFTPVINPPQVAILGIGAIQLRPVHRNDTVEFADAIALSLTCDHQVIDGAPGARFLQVLKAKIESLSDA